MAKDHGKLDISMEKWLKELASTEPPKTKSKRTLNDAERKMIETLLNSRAGKWTYNAIVEKWEEEHNRLPDMVGPPPHYNTARRIFRRIEKGEE